MRIFELLIKAQSIECHETQARPCKCRLFAYGAGLEFYVNGKTSGIVDKLANVVMNKAIEVNGNTQGVHLYRAAKAAKKPNPNQRKLF